jgi:hypothetical protein
MPTTSSIEPQQCRPEGSLWRMPVQQVTGWLFLGPQERNGSAGRTRTYDQVVNPARGGTLPAELPCQPIEEASDATSLDPPFLAHCF